MGNMGEETCVSIIKKHIRVMGWLKRCVIRKKCRNAGQDNQRAGRYNRITVPGVRCGLFISLCVSGKAQGPIVGGTKEVERGGWLRSMYDHKQEIIKLQV